jgi:hypothetical protein
MLKVSKLKNKPIDKHTMYDMCYVVSDLLESKVKLGKLKNSKIINVMNDKIDNLILKMIDRLEDAMDTV